MDDFRYLLLRKESNGGLLGVGPIENTPMLKLAKFTSNGKNVASQYLEFFNMPFT